MSAYLDRQSRPLAVFAGRKLRVVPTGFGSASYVPVSYTHLRAHETVLDLVCRLLLEKKKDTSNLRKLITLLHIPYNSTSKPPVTLMFHRNENLHVHI